MPNNYHTPVTRNNIFYSEEDFDFETDIVQGYIEEDLNQTVVVYEVEASKTNTDSVYKETGGSSVRYKIPKEIPCVYEIKDAEIKSYDQTSNNAVYTVGGQLVFHVLVKTLEKYDCDIKRGDYIGVLIDTDRMVFYAVVNDGKINTANTNYIGAYKTAWRTVTCSPVPDNEFNGK